MIRIDPLKLKATALRSARYHTYAKRQTEQMKAIAIRYYSIDEVTPQGEWRASETSPPRYVQMFRVERDGAKWKLVNGDPGWAFVEFGAHPGGGDREVLKYRPLGRALDTMIARHHNG